MPRLIRFLALPLLVAVALLGASPSPAEAQMSLDAAKAQGLVGERPDGLLGIVGAATPEVRSLVEQINSKRLGQYGEIARKNGTSVAAVQAIVGEKLIAQAPAGTYVMDSSGNWRKK